MGTGSVKHPLMQENNCIRGCCHTVQEKLCRIRSTLDPVFILCNIDGCMMFHHFLGGGMV